MSDGDKVVGFEDEWTREERRRLAGAVLDALGLPEPELDEGEREVIRRAVDAWRERRKGKKDGEGNGI